MNKATDNRPGGFGDIIREEFANRIQQELPKIFAQEKTSAPTTFLMRVFGTPDFLDWVVVSAQWSKPSLGKLSENHLYLFYPLTGSVTLKVKPKYESQNGPFDKMTDRELDKFLIENVGSYAPEMIFGDEGYGKVSPATLKRLRNDFRRMPADKQQEELKFYRG